MPLSIRWLTRVIALLLLTFSAAAQQGEARPNIVLFICDDMTWSDAGCYGSADVHTPNLDALATQGLRFNYCYTSTAMCAPTRQQLYTGLWPIRSGAYPNHSRVGDGTRSLGHHFAQLGYRVAISGKKHYGPASAFPFETLRPTERGNQNEIDLGAIRQYINRESDEPYFLICATNQPHAPWDQGDPSAYDPAELTLPPYLADTPLTRQELTRYDAEVTQADHLMGQVMAALDDAGQRDNTIFIFTSEQGSGLPFAKWTCYEAGLRTGLVVRWPGVIEPGTTTDAMVQYVDIVPTLIEVVGGDPTRIDTGLPGAPDGGTGFDGRSFAPVLLGQSDTHRDLIFGVHTTRGIINGSDCYPIRSVRDGRYKLILNLNHEATFTNILIREPLWQDWVDAAQAGDARAANAVQRYRHRPAVELYDLSADPYEMNNLAQDPQLQAVRQRLTEALSDWMQQQGDEGNATEMLVTPRD